MQGDIYIFDDDRSDQRNVLTRTSAGGWQYACDEHGRPVDLRSATQRDHRTAEQAINGFARASHAFENWWRRPL